MRVAELIATIDGYLAVLPSDERGTFRVVLLREASAELKRLSSGDLTEDEFQTICHRLSEDDELRFKAGCE